MRIRLPLWIFVLLLSSAHGNPGPDLDDFGQATAAATGPGTSDSGTITCMDALLRAWENDNAHFYDAFPVLEFKERTNVCGMGGCIEFAQPRFRRLLGLDGGPLPQRLFEMGGGFGRVAIAVAERTQIPEIQIVEHSKKLARHLMRLATALNAQWNQQQVHCFMGVLRENIAILNSANPCLPQIRERGDVALLMFGTFMEFSPGDKPRALTAIFRLLKWDGTLVIDLPTKKFVPLPGAKTEGNILNWPLPGEQDPVPDETMDPSHPPVLHLHLIGREAVIELATQAGFTYTGSEDYTALSSPPTPRALCYFEKKR